MGILDHISAEKRNDGIRMVLAGVEKIGKTSLATDAPNALLVPFEVGYSGVTCPKVPMLQTFAEAELLMNEILTQCYHKTFPFKTVIFDSVTALERHIHESILQMDSSYVKGNKKAVTMESALGGYGKAYTFANELFDKFLKNCDVLAVSYGINIIFTAHVFAASLVDPNSGAYDSWDLLLHSPKNQKNYGKREMITQWADIVGFLYEPMYITKGDDMSKGISANRGRVLGLSRTPSYIAGNRFGMEGEVSIPKAHSWNHFAQAVYTSAGIDVYKR